MPADSVNLKYLAGELDLMLTGGRINKITMPQKDTVLLTVRNNGVNHSLLICANPPHPRCHLTTAVFDNPQNAPSFLMHLRKHIGNGRILKVDSVPFERIINISVTTKSELAIEQNHTLCVEIMGKHSNIILLDSNKIITESIRHITPGVSSKRLVLPGVAYSAPPAQDKIDCLDVDALTRLLSTFNGSRIDAFITSNVSGFAQATVCEAIYTALGGEKRASFSASDSALLANALAEIYNESTLSPCVGIKDGAPSDFYFRPYPSCNNDTYIHFGTLSEAADYFYTQGKRITAFDEKIKRLETVIRAAGEKAERRLMLAMNRIAECADADNDKLCGELITANIYKIKKGMKGIEAENYYLEDMPKVKIPLDENLTPQANAQRYFKRYTKKKKTVEMNTALVKTAKDETEYLSSVLLSVAISTEKSELEQIENELTENSYLKKNGGAQKKKQPAPHPAVNRLAYNGFEIVYGKNNIQNDTVTKNAAATDIWFHIKDNFGAHVVVKNASRDFPPDGVIVKAAELAAYFSQARASGKTAVDYTFAKNVSKPKGSPYGKAVYENYYTVIVEPAAP